MSLKRLTLLSLIIVLPAITSAEQSTDSAWILTANAPAPTWMHGYPVGNGSMGALNIGSYPVETIAINHDSIWGRAPYIELKKGERKAGMDEAFELCRQGKYAEAGKVYARTKNKGNKISGFQGLGELKVTHLEDSVERTLTDWKRSKSFSATDFDKAAVSLDFDDSNWESTKAKGLAAIPADSTVVFRTELNLSAKEAAAFSKLLMTPIDDRSAIYINGKKIGETNTWNKPTETACDKALVAGRNVFAVVVYNGDAKGHMAKKVQLLQSQSPEVARALDLLNGESITTIKHPNHTIKQSIIASYPDQCLAVRLESSAPSGLHCKFGTNRKAGVTERSVDRHSLILEGQTDELGTKFRLLVHVIPSRGGTVTKNENELVLQGGDSATLLISIATDYNRDSPRTPKKEWKDAADTQLAKIKQLSWNELRARASADHRKLMEKCQLDLGDSGKEVTRLTTPERLARLKAGESDPDLIEQFFQLGRHMLISSSRPGSLPPNLQGLWEPGLRAAWSGDFHLNINVQMNMWPAEVTGLGECNEPFFQLIKLLHRYGQDTAASLDARGYAAGLNSDAWGHADWGKGSLEWDSFMMGGHWAQAHLMETYRYRGDEAFLKSTVWPILTDGSLFMIDWLREHPERDGMLIAGPGSSAENVFTYSDSQGKQKKAYVSIGNAFDHAIARETFADTLECARILGIEDDFTKEVAATLKRVPEPEIGEDGRLMEWWKPFGEPWKAHRHKSHLYPLFPGSRSPWRQLQIWQKRLINHSPCAWIRPARMQVEVDSPVGTSPGQSTCGRDYMKGTRPWDVSSANSELNATPTCLTAVESRFRLMET